MGNTEKAKELYDKGMALLEKEDVAGAIAAFTESIKCEESSEAYFKRGQFLKYTKNFNIDDSLADFDKALSLEEIPELRAEIFLHRARCYSVKNQFDKAIADYNKVIMDSPYEEDKADAYHERGVAYYKQGDMDNAVADFKNGAKLGNENSIGTLKNLGVELDEIPSSSAPTSGGSSATPTAQPAEKQQSSPEPQKPSSSRIAIGDFGMDGSSETPTKGKLKLEDGSVYEGDIVNGKPHGKGKITSTTGNVEEGNFVKGKLNGKGVMRTKNNSIVYEGNWLDGKMTGKGKMTYSSGIVEEGDFEIALLHGKGKVTNKNGDVFEGDFEWGHGKGKMTFKNGKVKEGKWEDGKFKGKGLFG